MRCWETISLTRNQWLRGKVSLYDRLLADSVTPEGYESRICKHWSDPAAICVPLSTGDSLPLQISRSTTLRQQTSRSAGSPLIWEVFKASPGRQAGGLMMPLTEHTHRHSNSIRQRPFICGFCFIFSIACSLHVSGGHLCSFHCLQWHDTTYKV